MEGTRPIVTAAQMRALEERAVERGATWQGLMERAGAAVARLAIEWLGAQEAPGSKKRVVVLCGPGNNGGDGLVVARHLARQGWPVRCYTWSRAGDDNRLREPLPALGVDVVPLTSEQIGGPLAEELARSTVVFDGLLGTGIKRDVSGDLARIVGTADAAGRRTIAIDVPTGVDSDTGAVRGAALPADLTVAIGLLKVGHVVQPGARLSGNILIGDIGLDQVQSREIASGELLTDEAIRQLLPARPPDANKGDFGKAMIVAGSVNYIGAAALATQGAMRAGAGLVTLATAGDLLPILATKLTECTFLPLPSDLGAIGSHAVEKLGSALEGYRSLLVGSGLGKDRETAAFLRGLLSRQARAARRPARALGFATRAEQPATGEDEAQAGHALPPLVLDADALNILAEWEGWPEHLPPGSVLTPHPGEMSRLTGGTIEEVQSDRVSAAGNAAREWKQVVVLKGAGTIIADPSGRTYVSPFSNPALATAGTGDVLAGAIAGLLAQGLSPIDAACAGVYLHGLAGELLRERYGDAGGLAGDLPDLLPQARMRLTRNA